MPLFEPEDTLYFGDDLKIKHAYFEYKGKVYAKHCICALEKNEKPAKRPWNIPIMMGGVACVLFGIRTVSVLRGIDGTFYVMLVWFLLAAILFLWAHRYNQTNIPEYSLTINMSICKPITISFADDEYDRNEAFQALLYALEHANLLSEEEVDGLGEEMEED